eukprot:COSAG05_NODE_1319_length_5194_cov_20.004534_7_plen_182_part_00
MAALLPLCCALRTVEQAAAEAERLEEEARQRRKARASQAQAERLGAGGALQLEGHPQPAWNGVYRRVGQELHGGFPRYEHASSGRHLYRYQAGERWFVNHEFTPDKDVSAGYIGSVGGEVPLGAQAWRCHDGNKWEERMVTVRELVRAVAPIASSAVLLLTVCRVNPPMEFICLDPCAYGA